MRRPISLPIPRIFRWLEGTRWRKDSTSRHSKNFNWSRLAVSRDRILLSLFNEFFVIFSALPCSLSSRWIHQARIIQLILRSSYALERRIVGIEASPLLSRREKVSRRESLVARFWYAIRWYLVGRQLGGSVWKLAAGGINYPGSQTRHFDVRLASGEPRKGQGNRLSSFEHKS